MNLGRYLTEQKKEYIISKQILRCGTNPGAMVREAANAESGLDFVHKLAVAQKETGETQYWLEILYAAEYINEKEFESLYANTEDIMKMLVSSIKTKKKNLALKAITLLSIAAIFLLQLL